MVAHFFLTLIFFFGGFPPPCGVADPAVLFSLDLPALSFIAAPPSSSTALSEER